MNKQIKLNRQLLRAVKTNSCDLIEPLLRQGADPLANNCRTLVVAIESGRVPILEKFFRHGIDLSQHHINRLEIAVKYQQWETLNFLLNASLNLPGHLEVACFTAIRNDCSQAIAMLLAEEVNLDFSAIEECIENDAINWFRAIEPEFDLKPQAASIVTQCVFNSANQILIHMLENHVVDPQVLNNLLKHDACRWTADTLQILITHGATGQDESTEAFIEAIKDSDWIDAAELLLPYIDIARIDDRDLTNLASCCAWDLTKQVLKRGMPRPCCEMDYFYAIDFVQRICPEDFFVFDDGVFITEDFLQERLGLCRDLAQGASVYVKHYEQNRMSEKINIAMWFIRCLEIKTGFDIEVWQARQLCPA